MQYSQFLPKDFKKEQPIAVIAGRGDYPICVVNRIQEQGLKAHLVAFEGETAPSLIQKFSPDEHICLHVGQLGKALKFFKKANSAYAIMAGQVKPKKLFHGLRPDLKAIWLLSKLKEKNAETIFGSITKEIENVGVKMLDARSFMDDNLAEEGPMSSKKITLDKEWICHGIKIAKEMANLDVGQGVVVRKGTVLAVEAFEGTDAMLKRAGTFRASDSLFVKTVKKKQDFRFDVPVFGPKTLSTMIESGIKFAALEAGKTLILHKKTVLETAKQKGICLFGYTS